MVIAGGYATLVSCLNLQDHPDQPEWLGHVNAGSLKVKLARAIIGNSSVHLLRTFIEADYVGTAKSNCSDTGIILQTVIRSVFILSAIGIACVDWMSQANDH